MLICSMIFSSNTSCHHRQSYISLLLIHYKFPVKSGMFLKPYVTLHSYGVIFFLIYSCGSISILLLRTVDKITSALCSIFHIFLIVSKNPSNFAKRKIQSSKWRGRESYQGIPAPAPALM